MLEASLLAGLEAWVLSRGRRGFELSLAPIGVRGAKTGHPGGAAGPALWGGGRAWQSGVGEGAVRGVGTDWPWLNGEALAYCFVLDVVSFEKTRD